MNSSADECNWGTLCRYRTEVHLALPKLHDMDPRKREMIERAFVGAQKFIDWLNESRLNGTQARIDRQYREGRLRTDVEPFSWFPSEHN